MSLQKKKKQKHQNNEKGGEKHGARGLTSRLKRYKVISSCNRERGRGGEY